MIHVDRSRVDCPLAIGPGDSLGAREREMARRFFTESRHTKRRFDFRAYMQPAVAEALNQLFHGKCAYCESRFTSTGPADIEMFRPKSGVSESPDHPGYWWLASAWDNLLVACVDCNRTRKHGNVASGKANRFPLADEANRTFEPDALQEEVPLLLDPCADDPDAHLVFNWEGTVASDTPQGQTTIAVLGLNRVGLVHARARAAEQVKYSLDILAALTKNGPTDDTQRAALQSVMTELQAMTRDDSEYAGMKRQLLRGELERILGNAGQLLRGELERTLGNASQAGTLDWDSQRPSISKARRTRVKKAFRQFEESQSTFRLSDAKGRDKSRSQRREIQRLSIRNFKGIRSLELDLDAERGNSGWLMLLGENSTGKSSVLQAIALCLAGADYFASLVAAGRIEVAGLVHSRARKAVVQVKLTGFVVPHELVITAAGATFKRSGEKTARVRISRGRARVSGDSDSREVQLVLLGYGATRLLPRNNATQYGQTYARIDNLFDAFLPLFDADAWLKRVPRQTFVEVALTLKDLLALDVDSTLMREKGSVIVRANGERMPIKRLSDGFQAIVALSIDILEVAIRLWNSSENAEGIVLLDEIGSHLHPTWKMRIVSSLRRAFPGVQFIATTHEPLCLRGLQEGEVVVMKRDEDGRIEAVTGLPSPSDFRVEQLLTSEFFGLNTTVDPEIERLFDEYYALLALPEKSAEHGSRLQALQEELKERRYVGDTTREQLMFEAVDQVIARHRSTGSSRIAEMKREATTEIARLWDETVTAMINPK